MTPQQAAKTRALHAAGCSPNGIANELGLTRRVVATELRRLEAEQAEAAVDPDQPLAEPAEPPPVIDLPALEAELPAPAPLSPAEQLRQAAKAKLEAEAARDNTRGYRELRAQGMTFTNDGGRHSAPPVTDPALAAIQARRGQHEDHHLRMAVSDRRGLGRYRGTI